jgi:hypothetical protein
VVHKVMAKSWVERVHILRVDQPVQGALETEEARTARLKRQREIIKAYHQKRRTSGTPTSIDQK